MGHKKIQEAPKSWPISRKVSKFVVNPSSNLKNGISILTIAREILKVAKNRKEVKRIIQEKNLVLNNKIVTDERIGVTLFDVISFPKIKKSYKLTILENGKFDAVETKEPLIKVAKIVKKTKLKNNKTQLNLSDGMNILSEVKCKTNDSLIVDLKEDKVKECLELKNGREAIVFAGKHIGESGIVKKIDEDKKLVLLEINGKEVNILISQLMIIK